MAAMCWLSRFGCAAMWSSSGLLVAETVPGNGQRRADAVACHTHFATECHQTHMSLQSPGNSTYVVMTCLIWWSWWSMAGLQARDVRRVAGLARQLLLRHVLASRQTRCTACPRILWNIAQFECHTHPPNVVHIAYLAR